MHNYLVKILEIDTTAVVGDEEDRSPPGTHNMTAQVSSTSVISRGRGRGVKASSSGTQLGGDEIINSISDSQMKKQIAQKLGAGAKKRPGRLRDPFNGKTEEELREEQRKLFENAYNYVGESDEEGSDNQGGGYANDQQPGYYQPTEGAQTFYP